MDKIIDNPNFTILTSGCNARCEFCSNKNISDKEHKTYYSKLVSVLASLPDKFRQVSISGGEPTISPRFDDILHAIKNHKEFTKCVLTTNGSNLLGVMML